MRGEVLLYRYAWLYDIPFFNVFPSFFYSD